MSTSEEGAAKLEQRQDYVDSFFYHKDVVHQDYAPPGQALNKEYYIEILHQLWTQ
jgi:hypothetical protein